MLSRNVALAAAVHKLRFRAQIGGSGSLGPLRHRFVWGEDAIGPQVPVGFKAGAPENPELHTYDGVYKGTPSKGDKIIPDYFYRTPTMGTTYIDRCVTYFISALLWFWFTYHMYYHPGHIFGHWYMPYLHEFTDEELGIPPDSEPDPSTGVTTARNMEHTARRTMLFVFFILEVGFTVSTMYK